MGSELLVHAKNLANDFGAIAGGPEAAVAVLDLFKAVAARTMSCNKTWPPPPPPPLPDAAETEGQGSGIESCPDGTVLFPVLLPEADSAGDLESGTESRSSVEQLPGGGFSCLLPPMDSKDMRRVREVE